MLKKGIHKIHHKVLVASFMWLARYSKRRELIAVSDNYIN